MVDIGGPFVETFPFISCGDFETTMTVTIGGFWMYHPATKGKGGWEFYHSDWPVTITNASNSAYFVEGIPGQVMNRHWTGEPFESDPIETGVQLMVTLPGHGVIFRDVGRIRIDLGTFEAEFMAGHWDSWDEDFQALCRESPAILWGFLETNWLFHALTYRRNRPFWADPMSTPGR
jgi:hypothetical protein